MPRKAMSARRASRSRASSENRKVGCPSFGGTVSAAAVIAWHPLHWRHVKRYRAGKPDRSATLVASARPATSLNPKPRPRPRRGCRIACRAKGPAFLAARSGDRAHCRKRMTQTLSPRDRRSGMAAPEPARTFARGLETLWPWETEAVFVKSRLSTPANRASPPAPPRSLATDYGVRPAEMTRERWVIGETAGAEFPVGEASYHWHEW